MAIYLVRHAHAGSRRPTSSHDRYRLLSDKGKRRAVAVAELLSDVKIRSIISSPATRCVQTVEPLAANLGLEVVEHDDLWEDADTKDAMAILDANSKGNSVICTHGNLIPILVEQLGEAGAKIKGRGCEKGSIWVLDHNGKRFTKASYISKNSEMLSY